jgi:hypothetical protein
MTGAICIEAYPNLGLFMITLSLVVSMALLVLVDLMCFGSCVSIMVWKSCAVLSRELDSVWLLHYQETYTESWMLWYVNPG